MFTPGSAWSFADFLDSSASFLAFLMISLMAQASWAVVILGMNVLSRDLKSTLFRIRKNKNVWNLLGKPGLEMRLA